MATTFYQNPFYDYVFGSFDIIVPSTRSGYKNNSQSGQSIPNPITNSVHKFRKCIKNWLGNNPDKDWPCKCRLFILLYLGLTPKDYAKKDIDNITKSLIDALKGIVYRDDKQIDILYVHKYKTTMEGNGSFMVGIKKLINNDTMRFFPSLYSATNLWQKHSPIYK
jgi:Holliday junction resolvase RusA-like endonuclease